MAEIWRQEGDFWTRHTRFEDKPDFGDFDFNHCSKCVKDGIISLWVVNSFFKMAKHLIDRERWPDYLNIEGYAPNRWAYHAYKWFKIGGPWKYRAQNGMTRDPYAAFGALYGMLLGCYDGRYDEDLIECYESVTIPVYLYRHSTWQWRKRLLNPFKGKFFVTRVRYFRAYATVKVFEYWHNIWDD